VVAYSFTQEWLKKKIKLENEKRMSLESLIAINLKEHREHQKNFNKNCKSRSSKPSQIIKTVLFYFSSENQSKARCFSSIRYRLRFPKLTSKLPPTSLFQHNFCNFHTKISIMKDATAINRSPPQRMNHICNWSSDNAFRSSSIG
jgi:hypothetical protein